MDELYHHGIKGQKWGVRRFQNEDGTLTSAGKRRYDVDQAKDNLKDAKANYKIVKKNGNEESVNSAKQQVKDAKTQLKSAKKETGLIADRKYKLIEKYKQQGLEDEAAETAANQRLKAEIAVAAVGTVAATVIVAKGSKYLGQQYCDKTIKSGKIIQNLGTDPHDAFDKGNPFFAAINKSDKNLYGKAFYADKVAMAFRRGEGIPDVYKNQIQLNGDVKRASVNNAKKIFYQKMDNDPEFRRNVLGAMSGTNYTKGLREYMRTGKQSTRLYESFNQALATEQIRRSGADKSFYSELKKNGYGALLDINDTRYSGYSPYAKEPTIFFSDKMSKISAVKKDNKKSMREAREYISKRQAIKMLELDGAYGATYYAAKKIGDARIVSQYLKEHPNSKLSAKEILENYHKNA